ncbi:WD repeat and HMG-box DNA-binding protein 1-like [Gigantopelta aegis]|uniref:WD repeat and HMG-box DNA-binding protein 1-like n=1 Tax=Gigantopelta aegis TaxID=1735272 RepID=UPI001B88BE8A|nr:WD repeat and HMG-box DNA-binding protein 1-like [Gigantopelta aegis]
MGNVPPPHISTRIQNATIAIPSLFCVNSPIWRENLFGKKLIMKPMRYAHSEGHTDLCYEDTGRYMLTCGSDGDVRIWEGIDDDDAVSHRVGDRVYAVAYKNGRFFTSSDANSVQVHTFPDGGPDGIVTRFTAPVNHMCFNQSGTTMVAGASDFTIKIIVVETSSHKVCHGHEAPILSVAIDPKDEYFASSSCDGSVRVWKMEDQTVVKSWNLLQKCNDVSLSKTLCRLCWSQDGKHLFVPVEKEVHIYQRDSWERLSSITDSQLSEAVSVTCLSPNGSHLAVGCIDGSICVLDWKKRKVLHKHKHQKNLPITALAWNPSKNNELAFCDNQGQLGVIDAAVIQDSTAEGTGESTRGEFEGVFDDDDDMLIEASLRHTADDNDSVSGDGFQPKKSTQAIVDDDEDDDGDFLKDLKNDLKGDEDDASSVSESLPPQPLPLVVRDDGYKPTPLQRPFQPASTPEHLQSRFMKWNSVGIIKQYNTEEENSIDIEFHDAATHHAMHITNNMDYTMADLSSEAVVVACVGEIDSQSKLTCMHFGSWDSAKEWTVAMPEGEDIQAVAVWIQKAKSKKNAENQDKKRKRDESETTDMNCAKNKKCELDETADAKKPLSQSTNDRLKNFAFAKDG